MKKAYKELSVEMIQLTDSYVLLASSAEGTGGAFTNEDKDGFQDDILM